MISRQHPPLSLLLVLCLVSLLFTLTLLDFIRISNCPLTSSDARLEPPDMNKFQTNFTYSLEDTPERWSIPLAKVVMEVEESVHYDIDPLSSVYEWSELYPDGRASVRFGSNFHAEQVSMPHQLHCIESLKDELRGRDPAVLYENWSHNQHCANFLRQWALCRADLTLERGDFMQRDFDWDRKGAPHECLDWQSIYKGLALDWNTWISFWKRNRLDKHLYQPFHAGLL